MTLSCFELGERMLAVEEAREAVVALVSGPLPAERVALASLRGRVLAEPLMALIDVPQNTNAAMDGVALAWRPEALPSSGFRRVAEVLAGHSLERPLAPGECAGITTGAPLPPGADTVIMREQLSVDTDIDGEVRVRVELPDRVRRGQNVRQAGEDIPRGAQALAAGTRVGAAELGLIASLGFGEARVVRRPRVAVFSTGDEVMAPGEALPSAGIFDANRFALMALVEEHGGEVLDLGILPDTRDAIADGLSRAARDADLVLSSGGVSVGDADHTRAALLEQGELGFWKIAIRPGRPLACGRLGPRGVPFLGLPGNPVASMVTFLQFAAPLLARLQGRDDACPPRLMAVAEQSLRSREGRVDYLRGHYASASDGRLMVSDIGAQGSGILSSMVRANCLIEIDEARGSVAAGESVTIQPLFRLP
ncbi:gephyrin-like molybdotransferase Glp [uncultured Halomonas sp.]|uniref:molybdopterin molybdotransferase MoeA n=1 Tax=uncultured Halomonas sp. TaxID=173971 RepID=UPI00261AF6F7|nr:gephyrin-like molybdotransferase Glp [uncultured Halomonas sp.]